jgi:nicotinate-nucleotide adenylyltransferase
MSPLPTLFPPPGPLGGPLWRGLRVGILGGSFNPPHAGHRHVSLTALRRLNLDAVWWMVSPGNPLKDPASLAPMDVRVAQCRRVARHPRIVVSALEEAFGTRRTCDTLRILARRFPGVRFVWICGFDNALIFHRWARWRDLLRACDFAFLPRPPAESLVRRVPATRLSGRAVWIRQGRTMPVSSTALRGERHGGADDFKPS